MAYKDKEDQLACQRRWYSRNKETHIKNVYKRKTALRRWMSDFRKTLKCSVCPESEYCCIDLHHLDPDKKDFALTGKNVSDMSKERIIEEILKCVPVCSNCHRKIHKGIINAPSADWRKAAFLHSV